MITARRLTPALAALLVGSGAALVSRPQIRARAARRLMGAR